MTRLLDPTQRCVSAKLWGDKVLKNLQNRVTYGHNNFSMTFYAIDYCKCTEGTIFGNTFDKIGFLRQFSAKMAIFRNFLSI